eukprot:NODE_1029_length_1700_cov_224.307692_g967_i0.p2 GENE.NODE_1029_length_1700_cov_224.307692_g967_i0~~NODE_1029_length_1700_cov_224.307692_g967_i0.p2  ORF type:complete len:218 (-),score=13.82 NODE_1029_length_1700_cov_224.307692_g967_i0:310-963(-)
MPAAAVPSVNVHQLAEELDVAAAVVAAVVVVVITMMAIHIIIAQPMMGIIPKRATQDDMVVVAMEEVHRLAVMAVAAERIMTTTTAMITAVEAEVLLPEMTHVITMVAMVEVTDVVRPPVVAEVAELVAGGEFRHKKANGNSPMVDSNIFSPLLVAINAFCPIWRIAFNACCLSGGACFDDHAKYGSIFFPSSIQIANAMNMHSFAQFYFVCLRAFH